MYADADLVMCRLRNAAAQLAYPPEPSLGHSAWVSWLPATTRDISIQIWKPGKSTISHLQQFECGCPTCLHPPFDRWARGCSTERRSRRRLQSIRILSVAARGLNLPGPMVEKMMSLISMIPTSPGLPTWKTTAGLF